MCNSGGGGNAIAERAEQAENEKQARIKAGMAQLDAMFGGGKMGTGRIENALAIDPTKTYYNAKGEPVSLMNVAEAKPSGEFGLDGWNAAFSNNQDAVTAGLYSGVGESGFNDEFFNKTYEAQKNYALPQVDEQFADAQKKLAFALARQGISASSMAGQQNAKLQKERSLALQGVEDTANTARNNQRNAVESERSELVNILNATGNTEDAMNAAQTRTNILKQAPALESVGPLFQNVTSGLADTISSPYMREQMRNGSSKGYGLSSGGSGKVVGS